MSKYTTEVRFICETECGLSESVGGNAVEEVIANARTKIFNFDYPIYDDSYKSILETKILYHYYTREIGFETVGLWKLKLRTKLNEIMPYYNQLYKSALLEFNPLWTEDYTTSHNKGTDGTSLNINDRESNSTNSNVGVTERGMSGSENTTNVNANENATRIDDVSRDKYSDTPQGALTDLENDAYLTNARKVTRENDTVSKGQESNVGIKENNQKGTENSSNVGINEIKDKANNSNIFSNTEEYLETVQGRRGKDASEMLMKYRQTFLNIDMQVIDELEELFMHLW